jgi:hypothetical protein
VCVCVSGETAREKKGFVRVCGGRTGASAVAAEAAAVSGSVTAAEVTNRRRAAARLERRVPCCAIGDKGEREGRGKNAAGII